MIRLHTCTGISRVLEGNPNTVGKIGGTGIPVMAGNAAAIPQQFGFKHSEGYRFSGMPVFGKVGKSGTGMPTQSFALITDTIGSKAVANVQKTLMKKNKGLLILELVNGYDMGTVPYTLQLAVGTPCP